MIGRLHAWVGFLLVVGFLVLAVWGLVLRLRGADDTPTGFRGVQYWTENLLVVQTVGGVLMLLFGRRVVDQPDAYLHYLYGSVFPLVAVVGGRIAALRRERYPYVSLAWGALVSFGLTLRSFQMGCGGAIALSCLL